MTLYVKLKPGTFVQANYPETFVGHYLRHLCMTLSYFREHCLSKPGVTEDSPFDANTLCFRIEEKIFPLTDIDLFESINLKCDPPRAIELREQNPGILPGYHMNKKHWNTVRTDGSVPDALMLELVDHSYELVLSKLPLKRQSSFL